MTREQVLKAVATKILLHQRLVFTKDCVCGWKKTAEEDWEDHLAEIILNTTTGF